MIAVKTLSPLDLHLDRDIVTVPLQREDWLVASVVKNTVVTNPAVRKTGVNFPHRTWSLLNRF